MKSHAGTMPETDSLPLIQAVNLTKVFPLQRGAVFRHRIGEVKALDNISIAVFPGETLGLVGESGCGKTTLGRTLLLLERPTSGQVLFDGREITGLGRDDVRKLRRDMQIIYQDPFGSLNPRMTVAGIVGEPLIIHRLTSGRGEYIDRVSHLLQIVGMDPAMAGRFPHEFSSGQRQRIGIARALAVSPRFIVCDEPVSALDVSIQAQVVNLLADLQERLGLTYLFISHDLAVVRHISTRIAVMYLGEIVEIADRIDLSHDPRHPYTRALLSAVPVPDPDIEHGRVNEMISGEVPSLMDVPSGCRFHPRCPLAVRVCSEVRPELKDSGIGHMAACHVRS